MKTVILAAGFGSRLWPVSTSEKPKQFQSLLEGKSPLAYTYALLRGITPIENLYVTVLKGMEPLVFAELPELAADHLILVPERRNTLPHTLWSLASISDDPGESVLFKSVDHYVQNPEDFKNSLSACIAAGFSGQDLTLLCTEYKSFNNNDGYCIVDEQRNVVAFLEKPDSEAALTAMAKSRNIYRSPLVYVASIRAMLGVLDELSGDWVESAKRVLTEDAELRERPFLSLPIMDISSMIFQQSHKMKEATIAYEYIDVGRFEEIYELNSKDSNGNAVIGTVIFGTACRNNLIINDTDSPLVVMDVHDSVIVQTANGSLMSTFEDAAKIGDIYKTQILGRSMRKHHSA